MPPVLPMLAKPVPAVPDAADYAFEPTWDAPRSVVFRS
jgi:hypothetical protein